MTTVISNTFNDLKEKSVEDANNKTYNEIQRLIKFNSKHADIIKLIEELGMEYLSQPDPHIKDWGKNFPRYLHLYGVVFGEGHALYDLLRKTITIELTDMDIIYMVICGIFWRYYNSRSIINHAILQLKASDISLRMTKIPYTPEIGKLLDDSSVTKSYPFFKRYGETLGYFNGHWLCDPSTYKEECKKIDVKYNYERQNCIYLCKTDHITDDIMEFFQAMEIFLSGLDKNTNDDYVNSDEWYCIIKKEQWYTSYILLRGVDICMYLVKNNETYKDTDFFHMTKELVSQLQEKCIIPE